MAETTLKAKPFLGGYDRSWGATRLAEETGLTAVAVSVPLGGEDALAAAMQRAFGCGIVSVGSSHAGEAGRVIGFAPGQMMVLFDHLPHGAAATIADRLGDAGYYVDQTGNWVALTLEGPLARAALERLCAVNLHPDAYPLDRAERTVMEHMGALVIRSGPDRFLLMSASSTGLDFLHALDTSLHWVS